MTIARFTATALLVHALALFAPSSVGAQQTAPPEPTPVAPFGTPPRNAYWEYAFLFGLSTGPFDTDSDLYVGGTLGFPIFAEDPLLGQKLMGELLLGWSQTSDEGSFGAPLGSVVNGLAGVGEPSTEFELTTFQVVPGVKYKLALVDWMEPYATAGIAMNVTTSRTDGPGGERAGGIAPISPDLAERGVPVGQGDVLVGGNFGGGVDFFLFENLLLGVDFRHNMMDRDNADFQVIAGKLGFRFAPAPPAPPPPPPPLAAPPPPPEEKVVQSDEELIALEPIYFDFDRATIQPISHPVLDDVVTLLGKQPEVRLRIEGHTDDRGSDAYNRELSERRSRAVADYLVSKGVAAERLEPLGFGESRPIAPNDTDEGRAKNRRTEFHVERPTAG